MFNEASKTYSKILEIDKSDSKAMKGEKDCAARASLTQAKKDISNDTLLHRSATVDIENSNRIGKTTDELHSIITKLTEKYINDNRNIEVVKDLAVAYEELEDYLNSSNFFNYAYELTNKSDITLFSKSLNTKEKYILSVKNNTDDAKEIKNMYSSLIDIAILELQLNPTDTNVHFKAANYMFLCNRLNEAIKLLQIAKNNPNIKIESLILLGNCYSAKNMLDLAIKQYETANNELLIMNDSKKEVLYMLGCIHEKMKSAKAIDFYKEIYEHDCEYKNVSEKIESYYV